MNESFTPNPWSWFRSEPELRNLYHWIDTRAPRVASNRAWGIWGAITGTSFGLAGGTVGTLAGALHLNPSGHPWVIALPLALAATVSATSAAVIAIRENRTGQEVRRAFAEARGFTWMLVSARWQGGVESLLGKERAKALDEGAKQVLRCHQALRSESWKSVGENTEYAAVRERLGGAMDVAMAQLVSVIGRGASADEPEVKSLLKDMTTAADEAVKTANRLAGVVGDGTAAGTDLRQALSEMRLLNQAQEEVDQHLGSDGARF